MKVGDICKVINPKWKCSFRLFDFYDKTVILTQVDAPKSKNKCFGVVRLSDGVYQSWFSEDELELVKELDGETALNLFKMDMVKEIEIDEQYLSTLLK